MKEKSSRVFLKIVLTLVLGVSAALFLFLYEALMKDGGPGVRQFLSGMIRWKAVALASAAFSILAALPVFCMKKAADFLFRFRYPIAAAVF